MKPVWRLSTIGCAVLLASLPVPNARAAPRLRHCLHCRVRPLFLGPYDDGFYGPSYGEPPPGGLFPSPGDLPEQEPQYVPGPTPVPSQNPPYPQGFVLDVPTPTSEDDLPPEKPGNALSRYRQVADTLAQCWRPPSTFDDDRWGQVTLRVSFKRDGTINGAPRIPYVMQGLTEPARSGLTQSLTAALGRCTPLHFTPALGAAIAGQIFALRFIEQDQDR